MNMSKRLRDSFESQISATDMQKEMAMFQQVAKAYRKRRKPITIRVHELDLEVIKLKASKIGVAYQTYIDMLIQCYQL
jgi:predicted DNA binding CopG/RHH family protein